ncbi:MAG: hypothetical protein ACRD3Q_18565 [Terriglobales bacterium]
MAAQYDNNMRGVLFKNTDKREGKRDPDYRGNAEIDRVQMWVDAWINTSKDGKTKYLSLTFKPKQAKDTGSVAHKEPEPAAGAAADFDDDIPF